MECVVSIDEEIQEIVCEALAQTGHVDAETSSGLGMFATLQAEFPKATIMTMHLEQFMAAVQAAASDPAPVS